MDITLRREGPSLAEVLDQQPLPERTAELLALALQRRIDRLKHPVNQ